MENRETMYNVLGLFGAIIMVLWMAIYILKPQSEFANPAYAIIGFCTVIWADILLIKRKLWKQ